MSLKPPRRKHHKRWIIAFIFFGVSGVTITGLLAKHSSDLQTQATREIHEAQIAATNANTAATNANIAATNAAEETKEARKEARQYQERIGELINKSSNETKTTIMKWQSDTESSVGKLLRPPRTLNTEQISKLLVLLKKTATPGEIAIRHTAGCDECQSYADQLTQVLKQAGWIIRQPKYIIQTHEMSGLWVMVHSAEKPPLPANKLIDALRAAKVQVQGMEVEALDENDIDLMVGNQ